MSGPVFHHFDAYGPVCGVRPESGVNAADMDPPEVTCRRCRRIPPQSWEARHYAYREGRVFVVAGASPDPMRPWAVPFDGVPA
jgi:hypothetical protein